MEYHNPEGLVPAPTGKKTSKPNYERDPFCSRFYEILSVKMTHEKAPKGLKGSKKANFVFFLKRPKTSAYIVPRVTWSKYLSPRMNR